jgi:putative redox protein
MNTSQCTTEQVGGGRHRIDVRGRHELHADLPEHVGGSDSAPDSHDFFDTSLVVCKSLTAMWFARKNGIPLERVSAQVERDDTEEHLGRYRLLVRIAFHGPLTDEQRKRLLAVVEKCPIAKLMTKSDVVIELVAPEPVGRAERPMTAQPSSR